MQFVTVPPENINENFIRKIGSEWMLITAGNKEKLNTMTASWGFAGVMWGKPCSIVAIRPQRYTLEFVEKEQYYSLCFFGDDKKMHAVCGKKSGRDTDKVKQAGLTTVFDEATGTPYFAQARTVLICKKLYSENLKPENFIDKSIVNEIYPAGDFHKMFCGEIVSALVRQSRVNPGK